jgi:hypothetical protein
MSFMRWEVGRGLLNALDSETPGSPWWRGINERLLRDPCEAAALAAGRDGPPPARLSPSASSVLGHGRAMECGRCGPGTSRGRSA